jgi:hypothetical protein
MRKACTFATVFFFAMLLLGTVAESGTDIAPKPGKSSVNLAKLSIEFKDGRLTANIDGASLKEVVQVLEEVTKAKFVLIGEQRWANQAIFAQVKEKPFEKALARIFRGYSYAVSTMPESEMPKVTIALARDKGTASSSTVPSAAGESLASSQASGSAALSGDKAAGDKGSEDAPSSKDSRQEAYVPYDLDDYMPLPEDERMDALESDQDPEPGGKPACEDCRKEARIERALSALDSEHEHLRSMAVDELTGMNDKRATGALERVATSGDLSFDERRKAAQALWHHAADLQFADSAANDALSKLANSSDPSIRSIAERALTDMERYQRRR